MPTMLRHMPISEDDKMDDGREIPEDVVEKAAEAGISKEQLEDAVDLLEPHVRKLPKWAQVAIGIGLALTLFYLRFVGWL